MDDAMQTNQRAIVIGGGVVGICSAFHLLRRGYNVTLIERGTSCATECSNAMAGGMQRMTVEVNTKMMTEAIKSIASGFSSSKFSYFRLAPSTLFDPHFIRWSGKFFRSGRSKNVAKEKNQLKFTCWAIDLIEKAMSEIQVNDNLTLAESSSYSKGGALKFLSEQEYKQREKESNFNWKMNKHDNEPSILCTKQQILTNYKWLKNSKKMAEKGSVYGGLVQFQAARAHANWFARGLLSYCERTFPNRLEVRLGATVMGFEKEGKYISRIKTDQGDILVDKTTPVVVAAGSWTPILLRKLNLYIPVYPLKGYTLVIDLEGKQELFGNGPEQVIVDGPLYVCRYSNQLRISSIGELAGWNVRPFPRIEKSLREEAKKLFPEEMHVVIDNSPISCGLRPFVADGNCLIGPVHQRYQNLFVNVGPGFNGWKISFGSGELLARSIHREFYPQCKEEILHFDESYFSPKPYVKYAPIFSMIASLYSRFSYAHFN